MASGYYSAVFQLNIRRLGASYRGDVGAGSVKSFMNIHETRRQQLRQRFYNVSVETPLIGAKPLVVEAQSALS